MAVTSWRTGENKMPSKKKKLELLFGGSGWCFKLIFLQNSQQIRTIASTKNKPFGCYTSKTSLRHVAAFWHGNETNKKQRVSTLSHRTNECWKMNILLMAEILHQLIGRLSHYLQGFIHPRWCRISAINSISLWGSQTQTITSQVSSVLVVDLSFPNMSWKEVMGPTSANFQRKKEHSHLCENSRLCRVSLWKCIWYTSDIDHQSISLSHNQNQYQTHGTP